MFTVSFDAKSGLVLMELEGFWDVDMVRLFADQTILALQQARAETGKGLVLSDARKFPVQRSEVGEAFANADIRMSPLRDKMAMVVGSALSKLQGQRALSGTVTEFFSDEKAARAWLLRE